MERKYSLKSNKENLLLRKGQSVDFIYNTVNEVTSPKLFLSCEDASWSALKNESGAELLYMLIDDSLNYSKAEVNRFCLDFSCPSPLPFPKRAVKKIKWQPLNYGLFSYDWFNEFSCDTWKFGIYAKAENLRIEKGGFLRIRADKWLVHEGVNTNDTTASPDETIFIDIPDGTYSYTEYSKEISAGMDDTACIVITVEGENYSGNIYFERPFFSDKKGLNLLPEFDRGIIGIEHAAWLGQNLNKRDFPRLKVSVNGSLCFDSEVFLKVHRFSPVEIELESTAFHIGENIISITYASDYIDTIPLLIDEVYILENEKKSFELVHLPEVCTWDENLNLLIETGDDIQFESKDFSLCERVSFKDLSFVTLSVKPLRQKNNLTFTLKSKTESKTYTVKRCVEKVNDSVISGSGDMIYIDISDAKSVRNYIKWYIENDVGNLLTIRQVYRWGGQRYVNSKVWDSFTTLCEKLSIKYVHISDGRDIPSVATNPTYDMLKGKNFLGRQLHERDGQLFYWAEHPREIQVPLEEFYDLAARLGREHPDTVEGAYRPFNIEYSDVGYSFRRNFTEPNIKKACEMVSSELSVLSSGNFSRHTGPSVMFKYFYQNGFDWCGAETMDGATEVLLAFLRGASMAYDKKTSGVHLALQWSTFPHDLVQRYRRYLLSLYIPYMHGISDINTEEGLWYMEAYYAYHNRLSEACEKNREMNRKFNKFIKTHSRTGTFYSPIAFLHGNMDGWNGFVSNYNWGMPSMPTGEDAESWKLLNIFYPQNKISKTGFEEVGSIFEGNEKPNGIFSPTPLGNVNVFPAEFGDLSKYKLLVFAGYNLMDENVLARINEYLKNGGSLICTWAHFTDTTLYSDVLNYNLNIAENDIVSLLSAGSVEFISDTVNGKEIKVCKNTPTSANILQKTDSGIPLVFEAQYGKGKLIFVNTLYFPGNEIIFPIYESVLKSEAEKLLSSEDVTITCGNDVEYTIFLQENSLKHYYFTAVDWYNDDKKVRTAKISFGGNDYSIDFTFGELVKLVTNGKVAIWPKSDSVEILSLTDTSFKAQGEGIETIYVASNGELKEYDVDFSNNPTVTVSL